MPRTAATRSGSYCRCVHRACRDVALVTKRGRSLSPAAQRLADVLVDTLKR
jgi:hypothetical protein